jgi:hypothetical protein
MYEQFCSDFTIFIEILVKASFNPGSSQNKIAKSSSLMVLNCPADRMAIEVELEKRR